MSGVDWTARTGWSVCKGSWLEISSREGDLRLWGLPRVRVYSRTRPFGPRSAR